MLQSSLCDVILKGICFTSARSHIFGATECGGLPSVAYNSFFPSDLTEIQTKF